MRYTMSEKQFEAYRKLYWVKDYGEKIRPNKGWIMHPKGKPKPCNNAIETKQFRWRKPTYDEIQERQNWFEQLGYEKAGKRACWDSSNNRQLYAI